MNYAFLITDSAQTDIESVHDWWRENRSVEEARRWIDEIYPAIQTLRRMPRRCSKAPEDSSSRVEIRQLLFGIGRHPTHRILFHVADEKVAILRVRHVAQDGLGPLP